MVITNFSAGELSNTLFGRTDIPQYYSGVSRLENFDVIPTGGIKRRPGTEQIKQLIEGEGRIIPFIVNRKSSYLLYLITEKIIVYKIENGTIVEETPFVSSTGLKLYKTQIEIEEVQYAQNFDTMILCHENYAPIEVKINKQNKQENINVSQLIIDFDVPIIAGEKITNNEKILFSKTDEQYTNTDKGWLMSDENYPKAVSFFNGRLIFAGGVNNSQRIFASAIKTDENYSFFTKKIFIDEKREYITITGKPQSETNIFVLEDTFQLLKFTKNIDEYILNKTYLYPEGTKIESINDTQVIFSNPVNSVMLTSAEQQFLDDSKKSVVYCENNPETKSLGSTKYNYNNGLYEPNYRIKIYSSKVVIEQYSSNKPDIVEKSKTLTVTNEDAEYLYNSYHYNAIQMPWHNAFIKDKIIPEIQSMINEMWSNHSLYTWMNVTYIGNYQDIAYELMTRIGCTRCIYFREKKYVGDIDDIIREIKTNYFDNNDIVFISLYTRDIIKDEYPTPDCGFTFEIASDMNDAIQWLAVNKGLIIGTETSEWIIPPGVHATNVLATMNSRYSSDKIQGTAVGDATCFFQTGKKALVEYFIPQQDTLFRANNMAMMSENMLRESPAKEFDYLSSPYTKLFITREDGSAVTLLYERSTGTFAWGRFTTNGEIKSAAVVPGSGGYDELYLIVKRGNNYFLEVLRESCEVYLDCCKKWNNDRIGYTDDAVINDGFIGYPYTSRVRSMPVLANDKMKPNNIKNIIIRFLDSFMPKIKSLPNEAVNSISCKEPYTGVWKTMFPGVWDNDVMFELIHDSPTKCKILAINAEVN